MQFLVIAYDGTDPGAPARRQAARAEHLAGAEKMYREKSLLHAAAILDDSGRMKGSMMLVEFSSKEAMQQAWLRTEPYVTGEVWQEICIEACQTPGFLTQA